MKKLICIWLVLLMLCMSVGASAQVFVIRNTNGADDGLSRLLARMEEQGVPFYKTEQSPEGLISGADTVLLFYNCQWDRHGGTNTDLLKAVSQMIAAHPDGFAGEIIIADSGQGDGSLDHRNANSMDRTQSVQDVVDALKDEGVRITGYLWDNIMDIQVAEYREGDETDGYVVMDGIYEDTKLVVSYPKFTTDYGTHISLREGIWNGAAYDNESLKLINMPILKVHWLYLATGAVKNYMGAPSLSLSQKAGGDPHNSVGLGGMGDQMAQTRLPTLNIMDMIHISPLRGPWVSYEDSVAYGAIAASTDPFALDYWAVKNVLMPEARKMNNPHLANMDPDAVTPGSFGYWMRLSLEALRKAGVEAYTFGEENITVFDP